MIQQHPKVSIAVAFTVMILYVPLYGLYSFGVETVFGFFAPDAFYYLTVAKNSSLFFFSFDGETATNGFHPLWQYLLTALFSVIGTPDSTIQLYASFLVGAVLVTIGYVFAGWSLNTITRSLYWPILLIPGIFSALFTANLASTVEQGVTYTYSPWSFMNGMESPCSVAAGGLFLFLLTRICHKDGPSPSQTGYAAQSGESPDRDIVLLGCILALIVLARLDDVFLVLSTTLYFFVADRTGPRPLRRTLLLVLPSVVLISAYLLFNYTYCHSWLPVSGKIKASGGAAFTGNIAMSLCDLFPPLRGIIRPTYSLHEWGNTAARSSAMTLPMIFAVWLGVHLLRSRKRKGVSSQKFEWLLPMAVYIVLKAAYNMVNVRLGSQGYWYYTLAVFMTNYLLLIMLWQTIPWKSAALSPALKRMCVGLYICFYLFTAAQTVSRGSFVDNRFYPVWRDRKEITAALKSIDPHVKLIDRSDGTYAYSLDMPAICALGFAIDKQGYEAMADHRFLEYCLSRGFNVTFQQQAAYSITEEHCTFEKIYEHKPSGAVFVKIVPSGPANSRLETGRNSP